MTSRDARASCVGKFDEPGILNNHNQSLIIRNRDDEGHVYEKYLESIILINHNARTGEKRSSRIEGRGNIESVTRNTFSLLFFYFFHTFLFASLSRMETQLRDNSICANYVASIRKCNK